MKMELLSLFTALILWLGDFSKAQKVFTKTELKNGTPSIFSFDGTGCPGEKVPETKGYYRYLQQSRKDRNILYVGAMNNIYKLAVSDLHCINATESKPDAETQRRCRVQGKSQTPDCQNHIRVVMEMKDNLLVCGTWAYAPKRFSVNDELVINTTETGVAMCPFDPMDNYTAILVTQGNPCNATVPYFGTYTDFIKSQPVLYRPSFTCPIGDTTYTEKTTDREDINWFNSPQFVGSYDDPDQVMFFFRETSVEHPSLTNKIYSRVGKVCKQDLGGGYMDVTKKKWLSFQKARLICAVPGKRPYYYDDIYDVYESEDMFYAVFYRHNGVDTSGSEYTHIVASSAVCVYEKAEIEKVFKAKFQYRTSKDVWEPVPEIQDPNPRLDDCSAYRDNPDIFSEKVSQYQLMADSVEPLYKQPIFYKTGVQFINIAVSETQTSGATTGRNIYLASNEGEIYDIFYKTFDPATSPSVEYLTSKRPSIYRPFGAVKDLKYTVWDMKYMNGTLLLGTDYDVTKLEVRNVCEKIDKIDVCVVNTFCKWSSCTKKCITRTTKTPNCTKILDWNTITSKGILESLQTEIENGVETVVAVVGKGLYTTLPLRTQLHVDHVMWVKADDCSGKNVLDLDTEKYAQTSSGYLMIKSLAVKDNDATFTACTSVTGCTSGTIGIKLKSFRVRVVEETDEEDLKTVWKQQFNDWSSEFIKWKGCANDYYETCSKTP